MRGATVLPVCVDGGSHDFNVLAFGSRIPRPSVNASVDAVAITF